MTPPEDPQVRALERNILFCYFLSGALGLVYQILWLRKLLLVFGSTVHAVSTVLTVFFAGLALGSWLFGQLIDRREDAGLRVYAWLELAIGLYAFATPALFNAISRIYIPVYRASGLSDNVLVWASFACSALILLLPTTLMGGTFPVISRFLVRMPRSRATTIAQLYAVNTAGAMLGTLGVYFFALPNLGLTHTLWCAGTLNIGIGLLCLTFDRHLGSIGFARQKIDETSASRTSAAVEPAGSIRWLLLAFALSGFASIAYEVTWTRTLSLVLGSSIYAFCVMLATFLGGMAWGSFQARKRLAQKPATVAEFAQIEFLLGFSGLASILIFRPLPDFFVSIWNLFPNDFGRLVAVQFIICSAVMLVPTILMGYLFPLVTDLVTRRFDALGRRLGTAYALNTMGGIAGSFLTGFVLIPTLGLPGAIAVAALVNLAAAAIVRIALDETYSIPRRVALSGLNLLLSSTLAWILCARVWQKETLVAGAYLEPIALRGFSVDASARTYKTLFYKDSLNATVSVHQQGPQIFLKVGGKTDASNGLDMSTQVMSAHIPLLLHPNPQRALVIGLGSGVTLGTASRYPLVSLDCAELEPAVVEGARFFKKYNYDVHNDRRTKIHVTDGRNFLLATDQKFDVIISEPSNPWMAGIANLFTKEFYELAKSRLAKDGVMCQWLQVYRIFPGDIKLILKTYHAVFPYVTVWASIPGDLLLIGTDKPQNWDHAALARRMADPQIAESLRQVKITHPELFWELFLFGTDEVERVTADVPEAHKDDLPMIEFNAPKALYADYTTRFNYDGLRLFKDDPSTMVKGYDTIKKDAAYYKAAAELWFFRGEKNKEREALEEAVRLDPKDWRALVSLGRWAMNKQQTYLAGSDFARAVAAAPDQTEPLRWSARVAWREGRIDEARERYFKAAALAPPDVTFAQELADFLRERKEYPLAAELYRSAVSQGGGESSILLRGYAEVLIEMKADADAYAVLMYARRQFPEEAVFAEQMGEVRMMQGKLEEAVGAWMDAMRLQPTSERARIGLARLALENGKPDQSDRLLREILRYNPYDRRALDLLAAVQAREKTTVAPNAKTP